MWFYATWYEKLPFRNRPLFSRLDAPLTSRDPCGIVTTDYIRLGNTTNPGTPHWLGSLQCDSARDRTHLTSFCAQPTVPQCMGSFSWNLVLPQYNIRHSTTSSAEADREQHVRLSGIWQLDFLRQAACSSCDQAR